jgi:hypothetical protein
MWQEGHLRTYPISLRLSDGDSSGAKRVGEIAPRGRQGKQSFATAGVVNSVDQRVVDRREEAGRSADHVRELSQPGLADARNTGEPRVSLC